MNKPNEMGLLNFLRRHYVAAFLLVFVLFLVFHSSPSEVKRPQNDLPTYDISKSEKLSSHDELMKNENLKELKAEQEPVDPVEQGVTFDPQEYVAQEGELKDASKILYLDCTCRTGMRRALEQREDGSQSFCSPFSTARGPHQKIFSFSGVRIDIKSYKTNLLHTVNMIRKEMPGWIVRIYVALPDQQTEGEDDFLCQLFCEFPHVDICNINNLPLPLREEGNHKKVRSLNRLIPFFDPLVDVFNPRDINSYSTNRELVSVKEWMSSDKIFHAMRDSPRHNFVMMGGMWGMKTSVDRELSKLLGKRILINPYGYHPEEKMLLMTYVWPKAKGNAMCHDSYHCLLKYYKCSEMQPYTVQRIGGETVGHSLGINVTSNPSLSYECPLGCRPKNHKDWRYC